MDAVAAMNQFKIVEKPAKIRAHGGRGKYDPLFLCLKNLANDKAVAINPKDYGFEDVKKFRGSLMQCSRAHEIKIKTCFQEGIVYVFNK